MDEMPVDVESETINLMGMEMTRAKAIEHCHIVEHLHSGMMFNFAVKQI